MNKLLNLAKAFLVPLIIVAGMIFYGIFYFTNLKFLGNIILIVVTLLGTYGLIKETIIALSKKQFGLDYIAILAIGVALYTQEYLVASILALMISTGRNLEDYGVSLAKKSLTNLIDRIPTDITLWEHGKPGKKEKLIDITVGTEVFIYKGAVIGLDGILVSEIGETDESSLTGEPYFIEKVKGDVIRSGTVNIGQPMVIKVTKAEKDSTYKKIITMVQQAEEEKSPLVRLADKYSTIFTLITLAVAGFAYIYSHFQLTQVLAILAVATPCPLIIATPIALLGGMNASAKRKIIIKKLASLEVLSRVDAIIFDKTGTITLGKPEVTNIEIKDKEYSLNQILSIAEAIERNSLHPLAKAIVKEARSKKVKQIHATNVQEKIGTGISGTVEGKDYSVSKLEEQIGMAIELRHKNKKIAIFFLEDSIKEESKKIIKELHETGLSLQIYTGDKRDAAERVVSQLGTNVIIHAQVSPEEKQIGIKKLKKEGKVTAMIGDGINDAPALALADVGMAFSNEEQTAASEAADIVFLGGDFSMVLSSLQIAKRTITIAKQSIFWGIGLSIGAMLFAAVGAIPPIYGAGLQEAIDVAVILNALRASR
ncbi:cadmium-translocating P-type ATPase [Candidatus Roizmanbacteria bacterium]|nr:cadmium-translocating P-type ATPase [Candidatus Roizmanbacteria bacterium]